MRRNVLLNGVIGLVAGAVGTAVMDRVSVRLRALESEAAQRREEELSSTAPTTVLAERVNTSMALSLTEEQVGQLGNAIHWMFGMTWGPAVALLAGRTATRAVLTGLGVGTAVWLVLDEGLVPVMGLTAPTLAYPWETHARAFANHAVYGVVMGLVVQVLDGVLFDE